MYNYFLHSNRYFLLHPKYFVHYLLNLLSTKYHARLIPENLHRLKIPYMHFAMCLQHHVYFLHYRQLKAEIQFYQYNFQAMKQRLLFLLVLNPFQPINNYWQLCLPLNFGPRSKPRGLSPIFLKLQVLIINIHLDIIPVI